MTATLTIHFEDGSTAQLPLGDKCVELDLPESARQSIAINQNGRGEFKLSYTKPLMKGKKWKSISIEKEEPPKPNAAP